MDNSTFIVVHPHITVIEATPENSADIGRIQKEGWLTTYPNEELGLTRELILTKDFDSMEKLAARAERIRTQVDTKAWMAYHGDVAVGFCIASKGDGENKLDALYVITGFKRSSIGSRLLTTALEWLGLEKDIILRTISYNVAAIRFYEKHGFELEAPLHCTVPDFTNGLILPRVEMRHRAKANM